MYGLSIELLETTTGDVIVDILFYGALPLFFVSCLLELLSKIDWSVGFFVLLSSEV